MGDDRRRYPTQPPGVPVYAYPEERTAPGVGLPQNYQPSAPVAVPQLTDDPFISWAKKIVAICIGVAAVGAVLGAIGEAFYVSKSKYEEERRIEENFRTTVNGELSRLASDLDATKKDGKETKANFVQIQLDVTRIKTIVFKRNRIQEE